MTAAIEDVETGLVGEWQKQFNEFVGEAGIVRLNGILCGVSQIAV